MKTVIEMALNSGDDEWKILVRQVMKHFPDEFERFAELVRADEREACAVIAETAADCLQNSTFEGVAAAIRARGNTK